MFGMTESVIFLIISSSRASTAFAFSWIALMSTSKDERTSASVLLAPPSCGFAIFLSCVITLLNASRTAALSVSSKISPSLSSI